MRARVVLGALLGALSVSACNEDTVDIPDELIGEPYCMVVVGSWGHFADGSQHYIIREERSAAGCGCIDPDDRWEPDTLATLNELAYEACEDAAKQWDFEWNECREDYESGYWFNSVWPVGEGSEDEQFRPADLRCVSP